MSLQRFYPGAESAQIPWLNNYRLKLPTHGPGCGLAAIEITSTVADLLFYGWILEMWNPALQQDAQEATAYKKLVAQGGVGSLSTVPVPGASTFASPPPVTAPGVLKRLFNQIGRVKLHAAYTPAIGQDLQIIGEEDTTEHLAPDFKLKVEDGAGCQCTRLTFTKFGHAGVWIESRRNGGGWEFLGIDTETPYLDTRPLLAAPAAETREYRLRFWDKGEVSGDWSAVQKVTVGV